VRDWTRALKRVLDRGELRRVLVVTTGSRATDLRRGAERLPGRKGRLARTGYLFLPVRYGEFLRAGGSALGNGALAAYVISGGSPVACGELIQKGAIPIWVVETIRDWISGECASAGRARGALIAIMERLHRNGGAPIGQTKLAKEAGLANNTVAAGWIEFLSDLLCVGTSAAWDETRDAEISRKPAKYPFVNLLAATAWAPESPRSPAELERLPRERLAVWHEWAVAQELFRRAAMRGQPDPERIPYWQGGGHEIDFVAGNQSFYEVKLGRATALDFSWFKRSFPQGELTVVCATPFEADSIRGITLDTFLRGP
jgi:predicted AAA+ superfamily ATPase